MMRSLGTKVLDYWDELNPWNQYGIAFISGVALFVLCLEAAARL